MNKEFGIHPELEFQAAIADVKENQRSYVSPPWIEANGDFMRGGVFNPDAYDPNYPYLPKGSAYILESNPNFLLENPFDLDNLRILDKEKVRTLLSELEEKVESPLEKGKLIVAMIGTGGTIAMTENEKKELIPGINVDQLLAKTGQGLGERFAIASIDFPTLIDSSQMEIDYMAEIAIATSWVWKSASEALKKRLGGVVVAHGTDTMAASSAYLAMMMSPDCPFSVGFVGAQRPIKDPLTDVFINIKLVFDCLELFKKNDSKEIFVAMGGHAGGAYPSVGVQKISDRLVAAFTSPAHPLLISASDFAQDGIVDHFGVARWGREDILKSIGQKQDAKFAPIILRGYTPTLFLRPEEGDDPGKFYDQIVADNSSRFVVLTTFGSFTANNKIRKAIMSAAERKGKFVLGANPFPEGKLDHMYEVAEALRKSGIRPTAILPTALGAKIKLAEAVYNQFSNEGIQKMLGFITGRNHVGEQPPSHWYEVCRALGASRVITQNSGSLGFNPGTEAEYRRATLKNMIALSGIPGEDLHILYSGKTS